MDHDRISWAINTASVFLCLSLLKYVILRILQQQNPGLNPLPACGIYGGKKWRWDRFLFEYFKLSHPPSFLQSSVFTPSLTDSFIHSSSALYNLYTTRFKTRPCIEILSLVLSVTSNITKDNLAEHIIVWFCVTISGLLRRFRFHDLR